MFVRSKFQNSVAAIASLALALATLTVAQPAHAATSFNCGTSGTYEVDGSGVLTGNTACKGAVTLDSSVVSVAANAMKGVAGVTAITSLVIPSSVISIGANAFQSNPITSITFSEGLQTLADYAFEGLTGTSRINLTLPDSLLTIGNRTFHQSRLGNIVFGSGLTTIATHSFYNNFGGGALSIKLSPSLRTIESSAFVGYRASSLIIPEGVTTIGDRAFESAAAQTRIYLPSTLTSLGVTVFNGQSGTSLVTLSYCGSTAAVQNYASFPGGAHPTGCFVGATYAANNGTSTTVVEDNTVGATSSVRTNTFTRAGYDFAGWTANQDGTGASFAQGAQRVFNSHETFYAQWTLRPKVLTFDGNGATSGSMAQQSSTTSVRLNANQFARSGYTFAGWNTVRDANGGSAYADQATFGFVSDSTLYAQWTENPAPPAPAPEPAKHKVTFEISSGENVQIVSQVVEENKTVTPPTVPTREGYKFDGWKVSSLGEFVYDFSKMLITSPVTISAVWEPLTYTVAFDSGKPGAVVSKTAKYSEKLALFSKPTKAGYKFGGWRVGSASGKPFRFSYQIKKDLKLVGTWIKLKK